MKTIVNKSVSLVLLSVVVIFFGGCKDVIEQDITNKQININSPANGAQSTIYKQLFWWNLLEGATQYSIQIVTPSFDAMVSIITDTLVTGDKFYKTLPPGKYQWRIRAENGAYKSNYQTYNLTMNFSSLDLQTVNLTSPANNTYQNTDLFNFIWETVPGATKYIIEIDTVSQNFVSPIKKDSISNTSYSYSFTKEGDYKWRVIGKDNSGNQTNWSTVFYTGYYATPPATPVPSAPTNNTTVDPTMVTFSWSTIANTKTYTLYLYKITDTSATAASSYTNYPVGAPATSKSVSFATATSGETIYWRVSATDKAGNQSALSTPIKKITIQ